jgi:chromosome segregation ATPase
MNTYYFKCSRGNGKTYQTQWMIYKMLVLEELGICKFKPMNIRKEKNMERMTHLASLKHYNEGALVPVWKCENLAEWKCVVETNDYGLPDRYIFGPAIDRLYEYEQLGMTPAEIRDGMKHDHDLIAKLLTENAVLRKELARTSSDLMDAAERNNVKNEEICRLRVEIDGLRNTVNAKDALIRKLVGENLAMKTTEHIKDDFMRACTVRHIDTFELDNVKLRKEIDKLYDDIHAIAEERDAVIEKNGTLAKRIGELEDMVSSFSNDKVIREKEIEKLEKIIADLRNDKRLLEKALMDNEFNIGVLSSDRKRLCTQLDKYKIVVHVVEELFGIKFDCLKEEES